MVLLLVQNEEMEKAPTGKSCLPFPIIGSDSAIPAATVSLFGLSLAENTLAHEAPVSDVSAMEMTKCHCHC